MVTFISSNEKLVRTNLKITRIIKNILDMLSEATLGPCSANQRLLISNKQLFEAINKILRFDIFDFEHEDFKNGDNLFVYKNEVILFTESIGVEHHYSNN